MGVLTINNAGLSPIITPITLSYGDSPASVCGTTPNTTYYIDASNLGAASRIYTNSAGTITASSGYYYIDLYWRQWDAATLTFTSSFGCA